MMKAFRGIALMLVLAMAMASTAGAQDKKKTTWVSATIKSIDAANKALTLDFKGNEVKAPLPEKVIYERWKPGDVADLEDGYSVGVWGKFAKDADKLVANSQIAQYASKSTKTSYYDYKVIGPLKKEGESLSLGLDGRFVPVEIGPKARVHILGKGTFDELKEGMKVNYPSYGSGDTYPVANYIRFFPPKE